MLNSDSVHFSLLGSFGDKKILDHNLYFWRLLSAYMISHLKQSKYMDENVMIEHLKVLSNSVSLKWEDKSRSCISLH